MRLSAHVSFRRSRFHHEPKPPRDAIEIMLKDLSVELARGGLAPRELLCRTFVYGGDDYRSFIEILAEPGEPQHSLRSWYEWQHPNWQFCEPPPAIDGAAIHSLARGGAGEPRPRLVHGPSTGRQSHAPGGAGPDRAGQVVPT